MEIVNIKKGLLLTLTFVMKLRSCRLSTRSYRLLVVTACGLSVLANIAFFFALDSSVFCRCENDKDKPSLDRSNELGLNGLLASEKGVTNYALGDINGNINCTLSKSEIRLFPNCQEKIGWMRGMWQVDPCYRSYGVDGSDCSILNYLSEVEGWCPKNNWQRKPIVTKATTKTKYNFSIWYNENVPKLR
ncbi:hypothetical protein KUTeg_002560 [Tegillarca granosa]|uniref:alpha-1,6-mannosyl-glycoprotein 6-beta-N-acetylglucosaminyltransferase n=1 Tax=Tegillarca granosa TaxID=220873 RepID=A0ABQ9FUN2_TEGGR|nr:hypothetical protein KUTeg_002560 [Tegillarca granosa]